MVLIIYLWVGIVAFGAASSIFNARHRGGDAGHDRGRRRHGTLIPLLRRGDDTTTRTGLARSRNYDKE